MIKKFESFEDNVDIQNGEMSVKDRYNYLMGKLLHLYSSIPLQKEKASEVIKKIVLSSRGSYYKLGKDVIISFGENHDKVRFGDYFDSLINSKDSRGHNFEGVIAGLFGGNLSMRGAKWDLEIDGLTWSLKFTNMPSKAPEIGSFYNAIIEDGKIDPEERYGHVKKRLEEDSESLLRRVIEVGGLTNLFKSDDKDLKNKVFDVISSGITGGWLLAYPEGDNIVVNIVTVDNMRHLLVNNKMSTSPKSGHSSLFSLALSPRYIQLKGNLFSGFFIKIPRLTIDQLEKIYLSDSELEWSKKVFGEYGEKIRADVLRYIKRNSDEISNKLKRFKDF